MNLFCVFEGQRRGCSFGVEENTVLPLPLNIFWPRRETTSPQQTLSYRRLLVLLTSLSTQNFNRFSISCFFGERSSYGNMVWRSLRDHKQRCLSSDINQSWYSIEKVQKVSQTARYEEGYQRLVSCSFTCFEVGWKQYVTSTIPFQNGQYYTPVASQKVITRLHMYGER